MNYNETNNLNNLTDTMAKLIAEKLSIECDEKLKQIISLNTNQLLGLFDESYEDDTLAKEVHEEFNKHKAPKKKSLTEEEIKALEQKELPFIVDNLDGETFNRAMAWCREKLGQEFSQTQTTALFLGGIGKDYYYLKTDDKTFWIRFRNESDIILLNEKLTNGDFSNDKSQIKINHNATWYFGEVPHSNGSIWIADNPEGKLNNETCSIEHIEWILPPGFIEVSDRLFYFYKNGEERGTYEEAKNKLIEWDLIEASSKITHEVKPTLSQEDNNLTTTEGIPNSFVWNLAKEAGFKEMPLTFSHIPAEMSCSEENLSNFINLFIEKYSKPVETNYGECVNTIMSLEEINNIYTTTNENNNPNMIKKPKLR